MSSLFQANLKGSELPNSPLEIAYGSKVTIKNAGYGGGLLHSHVQLYPEGSQQQQVTCYHHKDANNDWLIYTNRNEPDYDLQSADIRFLKDKDVIRLIHDLTGRNLHSHQVSAPVTKSEYEVSCYGNLTIGDDKDHWTVEVVEDLFSNDRSKVRTLLTTFRLRHTSLGCYLKANNINLPQWGFKQIEVTCVKEDNPKDSHTHWNIESHWNEKRSAFWKWV
jgi:dolichyl-phosphate-mannose-protein mannosyltransferase